MGEEQNIKKCFDSFCEWMSREKDQNPSTAYKAAWYGQQERIDALTADKKRSHCAFAEWVFNLERHKPSIERDYDDWLKEPQAEEGKGYG